MSLVNSLGSGTGYVIGLLTLRQKAGVALASHLVGAAAVGAAMLSLEHRRD